MQNTDISIMFLFRLRHFAAQRLRDLQSKQRENEQVASKRDHFDRLH